MKKFTYVASMLMLFAGAAVAQLQNGDLENWTAVPNYDKPDNWETSNGALTTDVKTVEKYAIAHSGSFAARLEGKTTVIGGVFPATIPGVITTGVISGAATVTGGQPYTTRSEKLTGYYQYTPSGTDMAYVKVSLTKWDAVNMKRIVVAEGEFSSGTTVTTYTAFEVPLTYLDNSASPDTQLIVVSSSKDLFKAVAGSVMLIDHMEFSGIVAPSGILENKGLAASTAFPNPASNQITIPAPQAANVIGIFDYAGKKIEEAAVNNGLIVLNTTNYSKGVYFYMSYSNSGKILNQGKFNVIK